MRHNIEAVRYYFGSPLVLQAPKEQLIEVRSRSLADVHCNVTKTQILLQGQFASHASVPSPGNHRVLVFKERHSGVSLRCEHFGCNEKVERTGLQGFDRPLTRRNQLER